MNCKHYIPFLLSPLLLTGCGSGDSNATPTTVDVSFAVSDAPVDNLSHVVIAITKLEFKPKKGGSSIVVAVDYDAERSTFEPDNTVSPSNDGNEPYQQINLLDFQGSDAKNIITATPLEVGDYSLTVHTVRYEDALGPDGEYIQYVIDEYNGSREVLKNPSYTLKLKDFTVTEAGEQQFTIDFDLRKSLILRGNNDNNNGYNLTPNGVRIIDNSLASSIYGRVDLGLITASATCVDDAAYTYLYESHLSDGVELLDNLEKDDPDYDRSTFLPANYAVPYASAKIDPLTGEYAFGFIPEGDYTVTISCDANDDDPVQYDMINIPEYEGTLPPKDVIKIITLELAKDLEVNFEETL